MLCHLATLESINDGDLIVTEFGLSSVPLSSVVGAVYSCHV